MPLDLTGSNLFFVLALFGAGLFCIMKGGDLFVDAATWIAESTGIPKFIIGATVVSFATTMPELLVSLFSAFEGNADIAVGNAVGSVTANTGLILCISLVCMQCAMTRRQYAGKACLLLSAICLLFVFTRDGSLSLWESAAILAVFVFYMAESLLAGRREQGAEQPAEKPKKDGRTVAWNIGKFVLGAAAIVLGAAFGKSELVFKIAAYVLFVTMFVEMMISFHKSERIPFQDLALVFTAGIIIPWMLSSLVRLGLNDPKAPYLLLPFVITWLSDSGAFFVGRSLGKTKLAPALSPHKTVEGCVGGFVCAIAAAMLYGLVLHLCGYRVQIGLLAIYGFFGSLAGQTGDLAFSAIKREHGVKDYSNLLPGHGGMLDRFDSTIFTAPMLELLVLLAPAIAVVAQ